MRRAFLLVGLLVLTACETPSGGIGGGDVGNRVTWRCDGGAHFSADFTRSGARVVAGGAAYRLPHVAGAGARYSNGSVTYWERAGVATLTGVPNGPYNNCRH